MKRPWFVPTAILLLCIDSGAIAQPLEVESKVTEAIIYRDAAQITRQAQVDLKEGFHEVILANVPENLNEATLSVAAKGTARAKILDAKIKTVFLEEPESELVRKLQAQIQELEDKNTEFNNQQTVLGKERDFLNSIKLQTAQQIPGDLVTKTPATEELNSLNSFLKGKWQDTYIQELEIKKQARLNNDKLVKLRNELSQIQQAGIKEKRVISIELAVEKAGLLSVSASYLMSQASWYPEYDARVDDEKEKVELSCLGIVKQTSGEDWPGVQLTLSTARPTVSGRMPELQSWILRPYQPPHTLRDEDKGFGLLKSRAALKTAAPAPEEEIAAQLYAETKEKLTSVDYKIARAADIKSDGTKHRLPVYTQDFSAKFQYSATPKLSPYAYLVTKVTNETEQLLPANVRIFLDDVYVGSSSIDAIGKGETFDLYLGIDEGVKVKRERLKEETKEVWIAGIKRNNKVIITTYKITLENYKGRNIKINLFDQIPVSGSDQIAAKPLEVKPEPAETNYEDRKGVMRWELDIAPAQKQEVSFTYQIEHPREMNVGL